MTLTAQRPKEYLENPETLGGHLRKGRLRAGLLQAEVAVQIGVDEITYFLWEHDRTAPAVAHYPSIFGFLGYDPFPAPTTLGERIGRQRKRLGLSLSATAKLIGVDEASVSRWERGQQVPSRSVGALEAFLDGVHSESD